jgi:hypothetical protein
MSMWCPKITLAAVLVGWLSVPASAADETWMKQPLNGPDLKQDDAVLAAVKEASRRCAVACGHP